MTKTFLVGFGKVAVGLVTALALVVAIEDFRGARAWKAERERLEAKGEELSWAKLMPSPGAGASGPQRIPEIVPWRSPDFLSVAGFRPQFLGISSEPDGRIPIENWRRLLLTPIAAPAHETPCAAGSSFLKAVASVEPVIDHLVEAARTGPVAVWDIRVGGVPSSTRVPPLLPIRRLNRLLHLHIAAHLSCGESRRAIDEMRVMASLQQSLSGMPFLITYIVQITLADELLETIHDGLGRGQLDATHRSEIATLLHDRWIDAVRLALRAERNWLIYHSESPDSFAFSERTKTGDLGEKLIPRGWLLRQAEHLSRSTDEALQLLDNPARVDPAAIDGWPHGQGKEAATPYNTLARFGELHLGRLVRSAAASQTRVQLIRTAFALQTFREKTGLYPAAISDLTPGYAATPPTDIVSGQPLQYRRTSEGFVLYSLGWDKKDNGAPPDASNPFAFRQDWDLAIGAR